MGMGETDLLALRYVLKAEREGALLTPGMLAQRLGISTASTTVLIDRLERSGTRRGEAHPTDRRSLVVVSTTDSDSEVRQTLGRMHRAMIDVADSLDPTSYGPVARFLAGMIDAVALAEEDAHDDGGVRGGGRAGVPQVRPAAGGHVRAVLRRRHLARRTCGTGRRVIATARSVPVCVRRCGCR